VYTISSCRSNASIFNFGIFSMSFKRFKMAVPASLGAGKISCSILFRPPPATAAQWECASIVTTLPCFSLSLFVTLSLSHVNTRTPQYCKEAGGIASYRFVSQRRSCFGHGRYKHLQNTILCIRCCMCLWPMGVVSTVKIIKFIAVTEHVDWLNTASRHFTLSTLCVSTSTRTNLCFRSRCPLRRRSAVAGCRLHSLFLRPPCCRHHVLPPVSCEYLGKRRKRVIKQFVLYRILTSCLSYFDCGDLYNTPIDDRHPTARRAELFHWSIPRAETRSIAGENAVAALQTAHPDLCLQPVPRIDTRSW